MQQVQQGLTDLQVSLARPVCLGAMGCVGSLEVKVPQASPDSLVQLGPLVLLASRAILVVVVLEDGQVQVVVKEILALQDLKANLLSSLEH